MLAGPPRQAPRPGPPPWRPWRRPSLSRARSPRSCCAPAAAGL